MTETSWAEENLPAPESIEQATKQRNAWCDTAAQHLRNEEYYRGLVIKIGAMLGPAAYISDDGSVQDSVLCAKVPELVANALKQLVSAKDALQEIFDLEMGRGDGVVGDYIDEVRQIARVALTDEQGSSHG